MMPDDESASSPGYGAFHGSRRTICSKSIALLPGRWYAVTREEPWLFPPVAEDHALLCQAP
jgi:hypothetical protein